MTDGKKGWKWWQLAALGAGVLVFLLLCLFIGLREPWIEPLPGVRTEMPRPFVRESDLGPDSAYRLMLEAIRPPAEVLPPVQIRSLDWTDALTKFKHHPWPAEPPPAGTGEGDFASVHSLSPEASWTREQYEDILRLVRLYAPQVALLDRALAAPDLRMPTADSWHFWTDYASAALSIAKWLAVSGHCQAGTGDFAGAFRDFGRILGLANLISRGDTLLNHSLCVVCQVTAADAAWVVASREQVPAPVLRDAARAFLAAADEAVPLVNAMHIEALHCTEIAQAAYRGLPAYLSPKFTGYSSPSWKQTALQFVLRLSPLVGSTPENTARNLEACFQHLVVLTDKPCRPATIAEYQEFCGRLSRWKHDPISLLFRTRDPLGQILASDITSSLDMVYLRAARRDAILRGMALFLAVRAYETEHGEPPETLDALVPDYLPRIPEDPFDGQPFRYLRRNVPGLPPEAWAVYGIGENFIDEGGTAHGAGVFTPEHGMNPDYVWPSVDYSETKGK
ncbi:MAG: hypothetical protein RBU25_15015 [Lentisphaeria bacterium]|jgi:hypothetical protein|nr:hypothetical protein [Lentisphaeria bacterium]